MRGCPPVPLDWLKPLWKAEKLNKTVQLTVSAVLVLVILPNVCTSSRPRASLYGRLTTQEDYAVLLNWHAAAGDAV